MRYWWFLAVAWVLSVSTAHPQRTGDFVGFSTLGLMTIDRQTSRMTRQLLSTDIIASAVSADNQALAVVFTVPPFRFIYLGSASLGTGAITTLNLLGMDPGITSAALALDQDGSYVVALRTSLLRVSQSGVSTFATFSAQSDASGLAIDADNGDYVVARVNRYLRVDRTSGAVSTMMRVNRYNHDLKRDLRSGHFWTIIGNALHLIHRVTGQTLQTFYTGSYSSPAALAVEQDTSRIFVGGPVGQQGVVVGFLPQGTAYRAWIFGSNLDSLLSLHLFGARRLSGSGSARPGSTYGLDLRFPASPLATYCCALSFAGLRPGITIGGRMIHVQVDPLFHATACGRMPGLTTGFSGRLDASGAGQASFRILSGIPPGTRITVAAAALNPTFPDGIDIASSITVFVK